MTYVIKEGHKSHTLTNVIRTKKNNKVEDFLKLNLSQNRQSMRIKFNKNKKENSK